MTVVCLAAGRAREAVPEGPKAAVLVASASAPSTSRASTTTVTQPRPTTSTTRPAATTTTTSEPAPPAATKAQARRACLALAAVNHYNVVAANAAWLDDQLRTLTADHLLASPQHRALLLEEGQALSEIDAQYTIDQSNCYLDHPHPKPSVRDIAARTP